MKTSLSILFAAPIAALAFLVCSCGKAPTATNSQAAVGQPASLDYSPRIGVAVRTDSRTCVAIRNGAITADTPVTLVQVTSPQSFVEARITTQSPNACPITQDVAPGIANYEISLPAANSIPKLTPLIAVVGTALSSGFLLENISVQADLNQTKAENTFRACGASDGIHLTVWNGIPITGTRVWTGYYYQDGNPGTLPTCSAIELSPPQSGRL